MRELSTVVDVTTTLTFDFSTNYHYSHDID